jgi:hypothetical protein
MTIEDDFKKPIEELYDSCSKDTQDWIDERVAIIRKYFFSWGSFVLLTAISIIYFVKLNPFNEPLGTWIQRAGSLISLSAFLSEAIFLINLNKIATISHPAQLIPEIYIERLFKPYLKFSLYLTVLLVSAGTIVWGYGDLLFKGWLQ